MTETTDMVAAVAAQVVALRELMDERDRSYAERFASSERNVVTAMTAAEKAVSTAMTAAEKAVSTAMSAAEKAVAKAEIAAEKRFDSVNEFRQQLSDQQMTFARTDAVASAIQKIAETTNIRFDNIERRLEEITGTATSFMAANRATGEARSQGFGFIATAIGIVAAIVGAAAALFFKGSP